MKKGIDGRAMGQRAVRGLSLVELMIALVLGLLVVGATFAIFHSNQLSYRSNEGLNRMQENARVAFELISQDVRGAGGNACSKYSLVDASEADEEAVRFRDNPVSGDSTSLRLVGGDNVAYRVVSATNSSITLDASEITAPGNVFENGDVLLLCNPSKTFVVEVTGVSGTTVGFSPSLPAGVQLVGTPAQPATATLARMRDVRWFVADNGRGGSSLYVSRMGGNGEEVAEGVENFNVAYLHGGSTAYAAAPLPLPNEVIAIRITMTLRGQDIEGRAFTRQTSNVVSLRKGSLNPS